MAQPAAFAVQLELQCRSVNFSVCDRGLHARPRGMSHLLSCSMGANKLQLDAFRLNGVDDCWREAEDIKGGRGGSEWRSGPSL